MKKKNLIRIGIIFAALILFSLFIFLYPGDNGGRDEGIKYLIGVSQPDLLDPWLIAMNDEIKLEAAKHPDIKIIFNDAAQDSGKQEQDLENMVNQGIDLLIVTPNDSKALSDTIGKIYDQGIPVIVMGYPIDTDSYTLLIYSDNKKIGREAGRFIAGLLREKGGNILEIQGEPNSMVSMERKAGFREEIKKYPGIKIGYAVVGYWQRDKTEVRVSEILKQGSKVDLVFAYNDEMAIGAWRVAFQQKLTPKIVGIGGLPQKFNGLAAVSNGSLDATFLYPTGGKEAIVNALKILNGEQVPKKIELQTSLITKENVYEFLK